MMSEKRKIQRFNLDEGRIWEAIEGLSPFKTTYTLEEVCEKLNEQQAEIDDLKEENEQLRQSIKELQRSREYWIQDNNRLTKKNNELIAKIDFLERVIDGDV